MLLLSCTFGCFYLVEQNNVLGEKKSLVIQPNFHVTVTSSPYLAIIFNVHYRNTQCRTDCKWEMLEGGRMWWWKTVEVHF